MAQLSRPPFEDKDFSWRWRKWLSENFEKTIYRGALIQKTSTQSIATGFNLTKVITFDEIGYDTGGLADLTNNRLIVPNDGHRIQLQACVCWESQSTATMRCVQLLAYDKDNNQVDGRTSATAAQQRLARMPGLVPARLDLALTATQAELYPFVQSFDTGIMDVEPGDQFELIVNHQHGSSINLTNIFSGNGTIHQSTRATWFSMVVYG